MHRIGLFFLLTACSTQATHKEHPAHNWQELREKNLHLTLSEERVNRTLEQCKRNQMTVAQSDALLCPVYTAHHENLPTDLIFLKIEEGLVKKHSTQTVLEAAKKRLEHLRQAEKLVASIRRGGGQHRRLVMNTTLLLEAGFPKEIIERLFNHSSHPRFGHLNHMIEAAEPLLLSEFKPDQIEQILSDFLKRDMHRHEIQRATEWLLAEKAKGTPYKTLHKDLWGRDR